jgi:hypothetical protein
VSSCQTGAAVEVQALQCAELPDLAARRRACGRAGCSAPAGVGAARALRLLAVSAAGAWHLPGNARQVLIMSAARAALAGWSRSMRQPLTSGRLPSTLPWPRNFLGLGVNSFFSFLFRLSMAQRAASEYAVSRLQCVHACWTLSAKATSYLVAGCQQNGGSAPEHQATDPCLLHGGPWPFQASCSAKQPSRLVPNGSCSLPQAAL